MMSHLSWIDFDPADRKRAQEVINLFKNPEARDEFGLAAVRDGLADLLFPATSTIQTRLRYMLFIPWIFQQAMLKKSPDKVARGFEFDLVDALKQGGETKGVIGSDAGRKLKRLPSSVYWAALDTLGIRRLSGSPQGFLANASTYHEQIWHPNLPKEPEGFIKSTSFTLRSDEAAFIIDRLANEVKGSLFFELSKNTIDLSDVDQAWNISSADISEKNAMLLAHAQKFSFVMHGAYLLYNCMLAKRASENKNARTHAKASELLEYYSALMKNWRDEIPDMALEKWVLENLFHLIRTTTHNLREPTRRFIVSWINCVIQNKAEGDNARRLICKRELQTKNFKKARLHCDAALERWSGASSVNRMGFRWNIAKQHLEDLKNAE